MDKLYTVTYIKVTSSVYAETKVAETESDAMWAFAEYLGKVKQEIEASGSRFNEVSPSRFVKHWISEGVFSKVHFRVMMELAEPVHEEV